MRQNWASGYTRVSSVCLIGFKDSKRLEGNPSNKAWHLSAPIILQAVLCIALPGKDIPVIRTIANPFSTYVVLTRARYETLEVIKDLFISRRLLAFHSPGKVRDCALIEKLVSNQPFASFGA